MTTIYLVTVNSIYHCDEYHVVEAFSTREAAEEYFNKLIKAEKESYDYEEDESYIEDFSTDYWCIYKEDAFSENHYEVNLLSRVLN